AQHQVPGNRGITLTLGDQVEDLALTLGEVRKGDGRCRLREGGEVMNQTLRNGGAEDGFAPADRLNCPHQFVLIGVFEQVATGPMAAKTESSSSNMVMTSTPIRGLLCRMRLVASMPLGPGILRSIRITSGWRVRARVITSSPVPASPITSVSGTELSIVRTPSR